MKLTTIVLVMALAVTAFAQAPKTKTPGKTATKPVVKATAKKPVAKPAANAAAPKAETKESSTANQQRRDPFMSVLALRSSGPPCAGGGKKCLAPDQVTLRGVVRGPNGPLALVTNTANKRSTQRENDPVYNGGVVKITMDPIVFRESVQDRLGRVSQREEVKKVNNSPV
jgi:hypothetical protein